MDERAISKRIVEARVSVLQDYPFFGRLLLKLRFGLTQCKTAFTDMRRIVFDPEFAGRLAPQELQYVLLHEVLHCALKHCTRAAGKQQFIYNVACDIVVNSIIMEMYHQESIVIDGGEMMHLAPDGKEGREYTAEQVYVMLMHLAPEEFDRTYCVSGMDSHDGWDALEGTTLEDLWNHQLKEVAAACGVGSGIPGVLARYLKEVDHTPRTNWRQILHDFIQSDKSDYALTRPDARYAGDFFLPSFCDNEDGGKVERLWFLVDTSGSISDEALSVAYDEILQSTDQIGTLSGWLSYFDTRVSEPTPFETVEELLKIKPVGGGGTSFKAIFHKLREFAEQDDLPNALVILTDGYACFPEEEAALGVPVIWIIVDSDVVPPWGVYAYIST